ncbi:MAG TPA: signal recognition particle protein Srp54 [Methanocorpusculum sp.]|nr:signal recognition particle protein [Candidatus Methanocorpusculum equi]MCQ2357577.1 signal recognition particle protein Srp54 [Methanocorpusculum sp.]HJJ44653.1 signal recognition particle protein Srp54 [Methanocorpusculum sp.]HJJ58135.1 signal recognition particle protein Srp54 [Methanocorpusculum sp.]HJJ59384.1 signal recognition particle protein Srp54 [Methanocorpusculum sp.]
MGMDSLSSSLKDALRKLAGKTIIDRAAVDELVKDLQRALLTADVNVKLVMQLSQRVKARALDEELPKGINAREHVLRIVYQELVSLVGREAEFSLKPQKILMAGLQGSGKTTTTGKLCRYFQRKGMKVGAIGADNFRPGAYAQLSTLCNKINVPCYGDPKEKDAVKIVKDGLAALKDVEVIIVDTAGRHALEDDLIEEITQVNEFLKPDHRWLVLDAAIGQAAREQARRFHEAIGIDGVIITKMDGTAKGGGAMSAVSETESGIVFIGSGETIEDLEKFEANGYISRLLGMGDLKALVEKAEETIKAEDVDVNKMLRGKFTLNDMYKQLEAVQKMGPLKQVMSMLPLGGAKLPEGALDDAGAKMKHFRIIMDSMTPEELEDPSLINTSRMMRVAKGSGTSVDDVRDLMKYYKMMQKTLKGFKGNRMMMGKMMKQMQKQGMG